MRLQDQSIHNDVNRAKVRRLKQEAVCATASFSGGLLRATYDLKVWRYVQAATLLIGIALIWSTWDAFRVQVQLQFGSSRGEDCDTIVFLVVAILLRVNFW
jgi:hypothetical protein